MRVIVFVCFIALALAGCGGKSTDSDSDDPIVTSGVVSSRGTGGANHPPTGSLAPSTVAGAAPLVVNFTLDGVDQDKDKLSWTIDANGDGKSDKTGSTLPSTVQFTYTSAGAFNVTYKLSDGKADVTYRTAITVTSNLPPPPPFTPLTFTQTDALPCQQCDFTGDASACAGFQQGTQNIDCSWTAIDFAAAGHPWKVTATLDGGVMWYPTCDTMATVIEFNDSNFGDEEGVVPEGAGCAIIFDPEMPNSTITLTIT